MRILFLSTRQAKPSFRFRVEQVLPYFRGRGHDCDVAFLPARAWSRLRLYQRLGRYDVVFLQKRLLSRLELFVVRSRARRLVYDLDDAVMFDGDGNEDRRRQSRFEAMAGAADLVICGNSYLAGQAERITPRVRIVPTAIDTDTFHPGLRAGCRSYVARHSVAVVPPRSGGLHRRSAAWHSDDRNATEGVPYSVPAPSASSDRNDGVVTIGWTGSRSTVGYLNEILPVLAGFAARIRVKLLSDSIDGLDLSALGDVPHRFVPWSPEIEIAEAATFDVGLMPLPDDPWTRGKCGFKALQYMALGIPAVCSPVGVNREIIRHGRDGFLPESRDDWHRILAALIDEPAERLRIGNAGRARVEAAYALNVLGPRMVEAVESASCAARQRRSA